MLNSEKEADKKLILHHEKEQTPYHNFFDHPCADKFDNCAGILDHQRNKN